MSIINRKLITTYSKVYGYKKEITEEELSFLDKNTWAKVITRLNHLARTKQNYSINNVIGDWFGERNYAYANELNDRIINSYAEIGVPLKELTTVNIWSNLTLLNHILQVNHENEKTLGDEDTEKMLFDIYLANNEILSENSDGIIATVNKEHFPDTIDYIARVTLTLLLPYHDLNHFKAIDLLIVNFIKSYYCFKFLEQSHSELLKIFLEPYGCENWQEYLKSILPIAKHAINIEDSYGMNYLNLENSINKEKSRIFLNNLSLGNEYQYSINTDFVHARARPLFKVGEDNYLILDAVLVVNRIYNSLFFELLRLAEKNKVLNSRYKDFFSLYTYDFIEKYLSYSVLKKIFRTTTYYKISGDEILNKYKIDTEPDYYIRNGNKVFLFEVKASIITGATKQSFSYSNIESEIKSKYIFNREDNEKKAVNQLVDRIAILFEGKAGYDKNYKPKNIRIYPILIVSDLSMTTPGINYILNQWFLEEVEKHDILREQKKRIFPLVIMDIDVLILYSDQFEENGLFESILDQYYEYVNIKSVHPKYGHDLTKEYTESLIMKSIQPFNSFINETLKIRTPSIFMEFGRDLLKDDI